jgi:UDP-N-acetylglucosamine 2-epimerase
MKDIEASNKLELQIITPENHPEIGNMAIEFTKSLIFRTRPVHSIHDAGLFYYDVLNILEKTRPSMAVVLGDRFEITQAALAATVLNVPLVHIAGGECTLGAFDNELRNSISQMSTWHFTATFEYAANVARMKGLCTPDHFSCYYKVNSMVSNDPWKYDTNIYITGSPSLDWLTRAKLLSKQELSVPIDLNQPFVIACLHPTTKELDRQTTHAFNFMAALTSIDEQIFLISPNCDPKNDVIRQVAQTTAENHPKIHIIDNLDHLTYLSLLQYAEMMAGNSSSGIIESASFNLPSVSVGSRQDGRIRGTNVFSCPCETDAILAAIDRAREWNATVGKCDNPYGSGNSAKKIVEVLENV